MLEIEKVMNENKAAEAKAQAEAIAAEAKAAEEARLAKERERIYGNDTMIAVTRAAQARERDNRRALDSALASANQEVLRRPAPVQIFVNYQQPARQIVEAKPEKNGVSNAAWLISSLMLAVGVAGVAVTIALM